MAKKQLDSKIVEKKFLIITSAELDDFMTVNHFSDEDRSRIKCIKQTYTESCLILYFLNFSNGNYSLDSFMPIYNDNRRFNKAPDIRSIDGILCLRPSLVELVVHNWRREQVEDVIVLASRSAHWQGDFGFGLQEDGMPVAELDISPYVGVPVKQGHIDFMFKQLDAYKKKAALHPEFEPYVHEIVKEIELMRRELDVSNGFTVDQMAAHDFSVELPEIDGKAALEFDGDCLLSVFKFLKTCIATLMPGSGRDSVLSPAAFAYSSTVLLLDIVQTNNEINPKHEEKARENVEKVKKTVKEIVNASHLLLEKGETEHKLDAFFEKTKIDPARAAPIVDKLEKVFPSQKAKYESVKIVVSGERENAVTLNKNEYLSFVGLNAQLKEQITVPPKTELEGFLGAVVVWDQEDPKFTIKTTDKKRPTIHYAHSKENDKKVRESIGKAVKIRVDHEGGKFYLVEWL
ncbi:MAG: hypothetical protein LBI67_07550 [Treponema sp.]|nr:hypothetical protein [Treponema sp.]